MPKSQARRAGTKKKPAVDWIALLRAGADGVKKWNRLTRAGRKAVDLTAADLSGIDLVGINLTDMEAGKASFARSNLGGASLTGGGFDGADFTGVTLTDADLSSARFRKSAFAGADLAGATFTYASLQGADLTGATLTATVFDKAWFDKNTKWPAGFTVPGEMTFFGSGTDPRLSGKGKKAVATDINGLMARLHTLIDPARMKRTLDMLKAGKNQLFAEIEPTLVRGVVRSQSEEDLVYSCVLTQDGMYACCTPDVVLCMGLRGEPCKHLLVLLIGLARAGQLDPTTIDKWVVAAAGQNHKWNKTTRNHVSDTLLRYKGVQAGQIDWRPTETIPEDFYAM
jgi:Pentapeptide repeats (8 copies)